MQPSLRAHVPAQGGAAPDRPALCPRMQPAGQGRKEPGLPPAPYADPGQREGHSARPGRTTPPQAQPRTRWETVHKGLPPHAAFSLGAGRSSGIPPRERSGCLKEESPRGAGRQVAQGPRVAVRMSLPDAGIVDPDFRTRRRGLGVHGCWVEQRRRGAFLPVREGAGPSSYGREGGL